MSLLAEELQKIDPQVVKQIYEEDDLDEDELIEDEFERLTKLANQIEARYHAINYNKRITKKDA